MRKKKEFPTGSNNLKTNSTNLRRKFYRYTVGTLIFPYNFNSNLNMYFE